jgi:hypothetical protein
MASFCVINQAGEPQRWGTCADDKVQAQAKKDGERALSEWPPSENHIYVNGAWESRPPKPPASTWDADAKTWVSTMTVEQARSEKWQQMKRARDTEEFNVFTWSGRPFDGDAEARRRISEAVRAVQRDVQGFTPRTWTCADKTRITLAAADVLSLDAAADARTQAAHTKGRTVWDAIQAAVTVEEVNAIEWPRG